MEFDSFDDVQDGDHNGVGFVEVVKNICGAGGFFNAAAIFDGV